MLKWLGECWIKYEIKDVDALGRIGHLKLAEKEMITPNLFPVIHPIKNLITPSDLIKIGAQGIFTNSYIIYQNKEIREKAQEAIKKIQSKSR